MTVSCTNGRSVAAALVSLAAWAAGCGDPPGPGESGSESLPPIVSNPRPPAIAAASGVRLSATGTPSSGVAYVSLPPGTVAGGVLATIRNLHTDNSATAFMAEGGFDPVAIAASAGDSLEIEVRLADGDRLLTFARAVPGRRQPVVVRTSPPPGKRDVVLNSSVVIIFSEPIDSRSVTTQSIRLFRDAQPVGGEVLLAVGGLQAEFRSANSLAASTLYRLVVTTGVTDLDGDQLAEPLDVSFTTTADSVLLTTVTVDPPAVAVIPGDTIQLTARGWDASGNALNNRVVNWSSGDSKVARVSLAGLVTGVSLGATTITATIDGVTAAASVAVLSVVPRILVDASRDGGAWWFPQWAQSGGFDLTLPHQGKALADYFRSIGYRVDELPRPFFTGLDLLRRYDVVIRASGFGSYAPAEIASYQQYVQEGGDLLLLGDHMMNLPADSLALGFGLEFAGITRGDNLLNNLVVHPITEGVGALGYGVGSGLVAYPASAQILGFLSSGSYLDLNKNGAQDAGEPTAPPVLGVLAYGAGRVVFCGDVNLWEYIPQPLVDNLLSWFAP